MKLPVRPVVPLALLLGAAAARAIVGDVTTGLDLHHEHDAQCASTILLAAATACQKLLVADSVFIARLDRDPKAAKRDQRQTAARSAFLARFQKATAKRCP